jgi:hypothetical protein
VGAVFEVEWEDMMESLGLPARLSMGYSCQGMKFLAKTIPQLGMFGVGWSPREGVGVKEILRNDDL